MLAHFIENTKETIEMIRAIHATIPWVKKWRQNFLRSNSSDAATCLNEPFIEDCAHLETSKSDIERISTTNGSTDFFAMNIEDLARIRHWYERQNEFYRLLLAEYSVNDLSGVPAKEFSDLGLGLKYVGQLLRAFTPSDAEVRETVEAGESRCSQ